ncbi:MAG: zinc-ribbon domain-containing protein [Candidatus Sabulitectum sp.]|nr:zinc-ribbon domain-containing protein [Candidatus Sabulitectum sp.]
MIVTCPNCSKKYQIAEDKLAGKSRRLRCKNCREVFIIHPPKEESASPAAAIDERAARFARVLASDMLIYNKDAVEQALGTGNLFETMAGEIERSWQLWKSRFPEAAGNEEGVNVFRRSLKDILAGGDDQFDQWKPE